MGIINYQFYNYQVLKELNNSIINNLFDLYRYFHFKKRHNISIQIFCAYFYPMILPFICTNSFFFVWVNLALYLLRLNNLLSKKTFYIHFILNCSLFNTSPTFYLLSPLNRKYILSFAPIYIVKWTFQPYN